MKANVRPRFKQNMELENYAKSFKIAKNNPIEQAKLKASLYRGEFQYIPEKQEYLKKKRTTVQMVNDLLMDSPEN